MISEKVRKILKEEIRKDTETDKKHEFGVWYPASDPPECDMYGLVLCISGKRGECIEYDHAIHLDDCNCYEEGKFWASGTINPGIKVHAWLKVPSVPVELLEAKEVFGLIEDVLDTLIEVGNGTTDEMLHEAADKLFRVRDLLKANYRLHVKEVQQEAKDG